MRPLIFLLFLAIAFSLENETPLLGDTDGPWSYFGYSGYSGEVVINNLTGSSYFYWLFQAIKGNILTDKLPLILWFEGGPGCTGEIGIFYDNIGPFLINNQTQPVNNPYTWTNNFHIMTIDYPLQTGFSFANSPSDWRNTTTSASAQLYQLLVRLAQKYPTWFNRDIYIFGESYAGHWIPGIAYKILSENQSTNPPYKFNLKGIGMGDPWVDPITQTQTYSNYGYQTGLINQEEKSIIEQYESTVLSMVAAGNLTQALNETDTSCDLVAQYGGGVSIYNVRIFESYPVLGQFPVWLGLNTTRTLFKIPQNIVWQDCNPEINTAMAVDVMTSFINLMPYLIENIKVVIYSGQDDLICNTIGQELMISKINWPYIKQFMQSGKRIWKVNGQVAGYVQSYKNLVGISVMQSGHMVGHDQPLHLRDLVIRFVNNQGW